jgi:hypothetical protein
MRALQCLTYAAICCFIYCAKDPVSSSSPVEATEEWKISVPSTSNYADISLNKHRDGAISCAGNWYYDFYGNNITCKIMTGTVVKDTTYLTFSCSGTASYPPDSSGNAESSGFTLTMTGHFTNGHSSGNWGIMFVDEEWNEWAPEGSFTGQIADGNGITD